MLKLLGCVLRSGVVTLAGHHSHHVRHLGAREQRRRQGVLKEVRIFLMRFVIFFFVVLVFCFIFIFDFYFILCFVCVFFFLLLVLFV